MYLLKTSHTDVYIHVQQQGVCVLCVDTPRVIPTHYCTGGSFTQISPLSLSYCTHSTTHLSLLRLYPTDVRSKKLATVRGHVTVVRLRDWLMAVCTYLHQCQVSKALCGTSQEVGFSFNREYICSTFQTNWRVCAKRILFHKKKFVSQKRAAFLFNVSSFHLC